MKKCLICGALNDDAVGACVACGEASFAGVAQDPVVHTKPIEPKPEQPRDQRKRR